MHTQQFSTRRAAVRPGGFALLALLFSVLAFPGCSGSSGAGGDIVVPDYDLRFEAIPERGFQVGRPAAFRIGAFQVGNAGPFDLDTSQTLEMRVSSGPAQPRGDLSVSGNGSNIVAFENVIFDAPGTYQVEVRTTGRALSAQSTPFQVGQPMDLSFGDLPQRIVTGRDFAVRVGIVEPGTGAPLTPAFPVEITLAGAAGGPETRTVVGSSEVLFEGLSVDPAATEATLTATAFGFPSLSSGPIGVDELALQNVRLEGSQLVRGEFFVRATVAAASDGLPLAVNPPLNVEVRADQAGLSGAMTAASVGDQIQVGPLSFSDVADVNIVLDSAETPAVGFLTAFGYGLGFDLEGPTGALPGEAIGPFAFRVVDGLGADFVGTPDPITWQVENVTAGTVVQSGGSTPFDASGRARVTPALQFANANYRVIATPGANPRVVTGPAAVDFSVAFRTVDAPGPFVGLRPVRVGTAYSDEPGFAAGAGTATAPLPRFGILSGELPAGLTLNRETGAVSGTPSSSGDFDFTLWARQSADELQPIRCSLAVFSSNETEVTLTPPDFSVPGPFAGQTMVEDDVFAFTSSFDGVAYASAMRLWLPPVSQTAGPAPLFVFHRARLVSHTDYAALGEHLASWGIACASVEDFQSFSDASGRMPVPTYDSLVVEAGMESAAAFMEAASQRVAMRSTMPGDTLEGRIDTARLIYGGHAFGGGAVHAAHTRFLTNKARGYVYFMPFDLRISPFTAPPGDPRGTPMYPIETAQPRTPHLIFSAEFDGDLLYPLADQLIERRTGPTTHVTLYGGVGSFLADSFASDAALATVTRGEQQAEMFRYTTAFVKRWADGDRSLDGLLYGTVAAGSDRVGVQSWRDLTGLIVVDDFQDSDENRNSLGGANRLNTGSRVERSVYPLLGGLQSINTRQNIVFMSGIGQATYETGLGQLDLTSQRRLAFRVGQRTAEGFDWVTLRARLVDGAGNTAVVTVHDRNLQSGSILPDFVAGMTSTYDRFVDVSLSLDAFAGIDRTDVRRLEFILETDGAPVVLREIYFDDLRFE